MSKVEYKNTLIKDIGRVVTGKTPETKKAEFYGNGYMFITPAELHDGYNVQVSDKYITESGLQSIKSNCIDGTSVMVGCIGWDMGNVAICHRKCATNQQINSITDFNPKYNPFYTYYWLLTKKDYLFTIASVTRTPILSKSTFEEIVIPMPDRSIQDNVVGILKPIDDMIENNKRICSELEAMAKTLYDYWFVQFDFPDENGKPYRTAGGEMVWNEQLKREIPKGWNVKSLSHGIKSINTGLNPRNNFSLGKGNIQYVTVKNLTTSGTIDFSGCDTLDEEARNMVHARSDINVGDILFASIAPLGRCYLIQSKPENWDINESVFSIRANLETLSPEFLYMYLMGDVFIKGATSSSTGSIFKGIRINTLMDMIAVFPPKPVVDKFSVEIKKILALKEWNNEENRELTKLRDWLLPMLMNGQARVE